MNFDSRKYQEVACENTIKMIREWKKNGLLNMSTWTGKTITSALIIKKYEEEINPNKKHIFVVPKNTILINILRDYEKIFPNKKIWVWNSNQKDFDFDILITTFQSLSTDRVFSIFWKNEFWIIVFDEAHLNDNISCDRIKSLYKRDFVLHLTATPFLKNKWENFLDKMCDGNLIFKLWLFEAINKGYLAKAKYQVFLDTQDKVALSHLWYMSNWEYTLENLENFAQSSIRQKFILEKIMKEWILNNHKNFLVYCVSQSHINKTVNIWLDKWVIKEWEYAVILWQTSEKKRKEYLKDFEDWKIKYIFSIRTLTEGVDILWVEAIINLAPSTYSKVLFFQKLWRVLRLAKWKTHWYFYDFIFETRQKRKITEWLSEKLEEDFEEKWNNKKWFKKTSREILEETKNIGFDIDFEKEIFDLEDKEQYQIWPEEMKEAYLRLFWNRMVQKKELKKTVLLPFTERDIVRNFDTYENFMKYLGFESNECTDERDLRFDDFSDEEIVEILKKEVFISKEVSPKSALEYTELKIKPFSYKNLRKRFWTFEKINRLCTWEQKVVVTTIWSERLVSMYKAYFKDKKLSLEEYEKKKPKPISSQVIINVFGSWENFINNL